MATSTLADRRWWSTAKAEVRPSLTSVRPRVETFPLERADEAFASMMEGRARFRAVLVP